MFHQDITLRSVLSWGRYQSSPRQKMLMDSEEKSKAYAVQILNPEHKFLGTRQNVLDLQSNGKMPLWMGRVKNVSKSVVKTGPETGKDLQVNPHFARAHVAQMTLNSQWDETGTCDLISICQSTVKKHDLRLLKPMVWERRWSLVTSWRDSVLSLWVAPRAKQESHRSHLTPSVYQVWPHLTSKNICTNQTTQA